MAQKENQLKKSKKASIGQYFDALFKIRKHSNSFVTAVVKINIK